MDLRELEKLHAQYATQPVVIDLTGQVAAIPALMGSTSDNDARVALPARMVQRYGKPVSIVAAMILLALAGGVGAGRLWQSAHTSALVQASTPEPERSAPVPSEAVKPVDAAPARPLNSSDIDGAVPSREGMASVNPQELLRQTAQPARNDHGSGSPVSTQVTEDEARAINSPIHAPRHELTQPGQANQALNAAQVALAPVAAATPAPVAAKEQPEPASTAVAHVQPAPTPAVPLRHPHRAPARESNGSATATDALSTRSDQNKPTAPAKSADVQLF